MLSLLVAYLATQSWQLINFLLLFMLSLSPLYSRLYYLYQLYFLATFRRSLQIGKVPPFGHMINRKLEKSEKSSCAVSNPSPTKWYWTACTTAQVRCNFLIIFYRAYFMFYIVIIYIFIQCWLLSLILVTTVFYPEVNLLKQHFFPYRHHASKRPKTFV